MHEGNQPFLLNCTQYLTRMTVNMFVYPITCPNLAKQ